MPEGQELYMEQPVRGLPNVEKGVLFRLRKSVYGLPKPPDFGMNPFLELFKKK